MERLVDITTPSAMRSGSGKMTGTEALSVPFEFEVVLHSKAVRPERQGGSRQGLHAEGGDREERQRALLQWHLYALRQCRA